MKKILSSVLLCFALAGASVFAFEGDDLKTYPSATPKGSFLINAGVGIGPTIYGDINIPPIGLTVDYNLPLFGGLPFTIGGLFEFAGSKYDFNSSWGGVTWGYTELHSFLSIGGRFGYHLNWGVDKLDTYVVAGVGWTIGIVDRTYSGDWGGYSKPSEDAHGSFLFDINIGARWFFIPNLGAFLEIGGGYHNLSTVSLGVAVKL
ncbi:hypothetical protein AGMMS4952_18290 [Spirochaetia bacterium]|nr:hypothetical protein AGMMS4952_18290 [Spirochaetia bacterium]